MPTGRGWAVAASVPVLVAAGRLIAVRELFETAVALAILFLAALWQVRAHPQPGLERTVSHARCHAGTAVTVTLRFTSEGRSTPSGRYVEVLPPELGGARIFSLPPIPRHAAATIQYHLVPARRGSLHLGPGRFEIPDPFCLAQAVVHVSGEASLLVLPAVELLGRASEAGSGTGHRLTASRAPHAAGEEFFAIREYVPGDDLRRVHWRSSARRGTLMIRQPEQRSRRDTTLVVDDRRTVHAFHGGLDSFERTISSAASLLRHFVGRGDAVALVLSSEGMATGGRNAGGLDAAMDRLAIVRPASRGDLAACLAALQGSAGRAVVVTTDVETEALVSVAARSIARGGVVVRHLRHSFLRLPGDRQRTETLRAAETARLLRQVGWHVVDVPAGVPLARCWDEALPVGMVPARGR